MLVINSYHKTITNFPATITTLYKDSVKEQGSCSLLTSHMMQTTRHTHLFAV